MCSERAEVDSAHSEPTCEDCPFCGGSGVRQEYPQIDTIEAWAKVLEGRGADEAAVVAWCTLWSASEMGKFEAVSIVHKIIKKESGRYPIEKVSAFVTGCVKNVWHRMRD